MSDARVLDANGVQRDALGRVVSGKLNPNGRPKGDAWFRRLCRKRTVRALKALDAALDDPDARVSAAKALLEFGWGKAPAVVKVNEDDDGDPLSGLTRDEVLALARKQLTQ